MRPGADERPGQPHPELTRRELEVFWLVAERLHNGEIAQRLHLSERTVESHVSSLLRKFGGSSRQALVEAAARMRDRPTPGSSLPRPMTPLLGREAELAQLGSLLATSALVTVAGPGGVGKTRLVIEAARDATADAGSVWFVELVATRTEEQVVSALATALRVADTPSRGAGLIVDYLRHRAALLVLDNCEQVVDAVARLATDLLGHCARLRVLVTSRQPLQIDGEQVLPLGGLAVGPATELFVTRAHAANPHTTLPPQIVRRIVERVDGLPLAVELAGARAVSLTTEQIEAGLAAPLDLLARETRRGDARHGTVRAVLDWSFDLLEADDRAAAAKLSVFAGPFPLDVACAVIGEDASVHIERLLSRSLLSRSADLAFEAQYRMLEVVSQYAHERADPGTLSAARHRHLAHHADFARQLHAGLRTSSAPAWAELGRARVDDLRAAVAFALDQRVPVAGELVADLHWPWFLDGRHAEYRSWLAPAHALTTDPRTRARLDRTLGSTSIAQGDIAATEQAVTRLLRAGRELGDDELIALGLNLQGMAEWARGDPCAITSQLPGLRHARRAGQPWVLVLILALTGRSAHAAGDHRAGRALLREAVQRAEQLGEPMVLGSALDYQAHAEFAAGTYGRAAELTARALHAYRQIGYQEGIASASTLAAGLAALAGRHEHAEQMLTEALDVCQRTGHVGGMATVLEASALLHHQRGDHAAALRALIAGRARRTASNTSAPPELAESLHRLESHVLPPSGPDAGDHVPEPIERL